MRLTDKTVSDLLASFRSTNPTPGGGSASALAAAVGASLLAMVAGLPRPRAASDGERARLAAAGAACADAAQRLETLIDADASAYDRVMTAYRLPKATAAETATRSARIQDALGAAIDAPLGVMRAGARAIAEAALVAAFGNRNASSDVQVALELLGAGVRGARLNVDINLASLKDAALAGRLRSESARLAAEAAEGMAAAHRRLADGS